MSFKMISGRVDITEPGGTPQEYERLLLTENPDESRTLRTVTYSPKGDLLRDVNQMVAANWRPIEAMGRLFYQGKSQGTVLRRVIKNRLCSYIWSTSQDADYQEFEAPQKMSIGFHPITHDAWKMAYIRTDTKDYQEVLTHTVSNSWNGRSLGHGMQLRSTARFEKTETLETPVGKLECEKFVWKTSFGKELHVWRTGPHHLLARMFVASGGKAGTIYELATLEEKAVNWESS